MESMRIPIKTKVINIPALWDGLNRRQFKESIKIDSHKTLTDSERFAESLQQ